MRTHYCDRLLPLSKLQRRSVLSIIAVIIVAAVYMLAVAPVFQQRTSLQNTFVSAKAQLSVPVKEVQLATSAALPAIPQHIQLSAFNREQTIVKLTLQGDFADLGAWLQQLAHTDWAPIYKFWQWQRQQIELTLHLQRFEMQIAKLPDAMQNPFPTLQQYPIAAEKLILKPCSQRLPKDFTIAAIRHQEVALHYNNQTTRWLRAETAITPYALIIQHIGEGSVMIAHHHVNVGPEFTTAKPATTECVPSTLRFNIPGQQYIRWLP